MFSFLNPKRLLITGLIFSIPTILLIIELSDLFGFGITHLKGRVLVVWFLSMYLGGLLLGVGMFWWWGRRKNIYAKWLFRFATAFLVIVLLVAGGVISLPYYCTETYRPHGDSPSGPVYMDPVCVSSHFPWQISFWSNMIEGREFAWRRVNILGALWEEGVLDLLDEWNRTL